MPWRRSLACGRTRGLAIPADGGFRKDLVGVAKEKIFDLAAGQADLPRRAKNAPQLFVEKRGKFDRMSGIENGCSDGVILPHQISVLIVDFHRFPSQEGDGGIGAE